MDKYDFFFYGYNGTRPEIIKMAPVIQEINNDPELYLIFVHSGQHYDYKLSKKFIKELELPSPDLNFNIYSGTHAARAN